MKNLNKYLLASAGAFVFALSGGGGVNSALAACVQGSQCSVTDGSTVNVVGGIYEVVGLSPTDAAFYVNGVGSSLHISSVTLKDLISYTQYYDASNNLWAYNSSYSVYAEGGGVIHLKDFVLEKNPEPYFDLAVSTGAGSQVILENVTIRSDDASYYALGQVEYGGYLKFVNVTDLSSKGGGGTVSVSKNSTADFIDSFVSGTLQFGKNWSGTKDTSVNTVNMQGGFLGSISSMSGYNTFNVTNGTVGYAERDSWQLVYVSSVLQPGRGGTSQLLDASNLTINAHHSQLYGTVSKGDSAILNMNLTGNSNWTVGSLSDGKSPILISDLSTLNIDNSTVTFKLPHLDFKTGQLLYHTIHVDGGVNAYRSNNGHIVFNTFVNDGGLPANQFTNKLTITGDVVGKTQVSVNEMLGSTGDVNWTSQDGTNLAHEGISLIQVSGNVATDSFYFDGGYTTFHRQPYVYKLYSFEDTSAGTWDFRLQNEWLWDGDDWRRQVVPQVSTYLTAPNALFRAHHMNLGNLQKRMDDIRRDRAQFSEAENVAADGDDERKKSRNIFLQAYSGTYDYQTDLAVLDYGYNGNIDYKGLSFGGNLFNFERQRDREDAKEGSEFLFGLSGSYGSLAIETDKEDSRKSTLDVYSVTPYLIWLKDSGFYADVSLSYGMFDGKVATKRYEKTAQLKGSSLGASVDIGMPFALGSNGWSVEPQAGFVYQKLSFNAHEDADNFPIELGAPVQMSGRLGGKLMKETIFESMRKFMIYGTLNYLHDITGGNHEVWLGDDFQVGTFGNHIEGGLGLNLAMNKLSLFGDFTWTQAVGSAGSSGISFNGGANLKF